MVVRIVVSPNQDHVAGPQRCDGEVDGCVPARGQNVPCETRPNLARLIVPLVPGSRSPLSGRQIDFPHGRGRALTG